MFCSAEEMWKANFTDYSRVGGMKLKIEGENNTVGCKRFFTNSKIDVVEELIAFADQGPQYSYSYRFLKPGNSLLTSGIRILVFDKESVFLFNYLAFGAQEYSNTVIVVPRGDRMCTVACIFSWKSGTLEESEKFEKTMSRMLIRWLSSLDDK